ncbi:hypothetical protein VPH35_077824 [Triticum aestivum]|uniref:Uncharacterized protein n=1 Tax=Aegilops tauschii subsp. strangulata TaxID=200361 RepID=A0A453HWK8_AEGTS
MVELANNECLAPRISVGDEELLNHADATKACCFSMTAAAMVLVKVPTISANNESHLLAKYGVLPSPSTPAGERGIESCKRELLHIAQQEHNDDTNLERIPERQPTFASESGSCSYETTYPSYSFICFSIYYCTSHYSLPIIHASITWME